MIVARDAPDGERPDDAATPGPLSDLGANDTVRPEVLAHPSRREAERQGGTEGDTRAASASARLPLGALGLVAVLLELVAVAAVTVVLGSSYLRDGD